MSAGAFSEIRSTKVVECPFCATGGHYLIPRVDKADVYFLQSYLPSVRVGN
jgi:hypothetical protein